MTWSFGWLQPAWLLLLPLMLLPLLRDARAEQAHSWLGLVPEDRWSTALRFALRAIGALAVAALVLGLAGLYRASYEVERVGQGAEIALLLDRSRSMDERFMTAPKPGVAAPGTSAWYAYAPSETQGRHVTKGEAARKLLGDFVAQRSEDRFAMAVFSSLPIPVLGFTQKTEAVQAAIDAGDVGRGLGETDIGLALLHGLSLFEDRAYTGSRILLLVSDGGDHLDPTIRERIAERMREYRVTLYWIYIRSARSPGLQAEPGSDAKAAETVPEVFLDRYFRSIGTPYRAYEAENPEALERAIADVGRLENRPILYTDVIPRRDLSTLAYAVALAGLLVLTAARWQERAR